MKKRISPKHSMDGSIQWISTTLVIWLSKHHWMRCYIWRCIYWTLRPVASMNTNLEGYTSRSIYFGDLAKWWDKVLTLFCWKLQTRSIFNGTHFGYELNVNREKFRIFSLNRTEAGVQLFSIAFREKWWIWLVCARVNECVFAAEKWAARTKLMCDLKATVSNCRRHRCCVCGWLLFRLWLCVTSNQN